MNEEISATFYRIVFQVFLPGYENIKSFKEEFGKAGFLDGKVGSCLSVNGFETDIPLRSVYVMLRPEDQERFSEWFDDFRQHHQPS